MYKSVIKVILLGCLLMNTASVYARYIKVSNSGISVSDNAVMGNGPDDWACTYDNDSKLLWEVKTDDGGMRDKDWSYIWYDPEQAHIGGITGVEQNRFNSFNCENNGFCNTNDYKNRLNNVFQSSFIHTKHNTAQLVILQGKSTRILLFYKVNQQLRQ